MNLITCTAKNRQVATNLLTSSRHLLQQADIRMRSHGLLTTSLFKVVNRLVASRLSKLDIYRLAASLFNKLYSQVCIQQTILKDL